MSDDPRIAELVHLAECLDRMATAMVPVSAFVEGIEEGHRQCADLIRDRARVIAGVGVGEPIVTPDYGHDPVPDPSMLGLEEEAIGP